MGKEDWLLEEDESAHAARAARRRFLEDLALTAASAHGYRFICSLLENLGAERPCPNDPALMARRNLAEDLLSDLAEANPKAALAAIATLRKIDFTGGKNV